MSLSTPAAVPLADKDVNSSDMEIDDDDDDVEEEGEDELHASSKRNGASNIMESKEHDGHPGSNLLSAPRSLPDEPLATQGVDLCINFEGSNLPISRKRAVKEKAIQEYEINGQDARVVLERKAPENHGQHTNSKSHLVGAEIMHETANRSSVDGKEVISIPARYHSGAGVSSHLGLKQNSKQICIQTKDDKWSMKLRFYRSAAPQTITGSLSHGDNFNGENKHPALICDFFAKGWCIKGSSGKFIHIKDTGSNSRQQPEKDVATADEKIDVQLGEAERSGPPSPGSSDRLHSSVRNKTALSPLLQSMDKPITSLGPQHFPASIDDFGPSKEVRQNSIGQSLPADNYIRPCLLSDRGSSTFGNSFLPKHIPSSSGSVTSLGNIYKEEQNFRVSTWLASLPLSSSQSARTHAAQKMLDNNREHHTSWLSSLLQGSSPFSNFEPENFTVSDIARNPLHFAEYRVKFSSDDWEPSVPFRPSLFVTFGPSSPRCQYGPLCDSIDLSSVGKGSLIFSFCSQGPSLLNVAYPPTCSDSASAGPLVPECSVDKRSASSHGRHLEKLVNNNCYTSVKDSTTDANDGTSAADMQNGTLAKEEISSVASHVKDILKTRKNDNDRNARHGRDGFGCKIDLKADIVREKNETDIEHKSDGDALGESKAMKHFHTALVDLIKEILKPASREGRLSKDVHNRIVKKAVDRVIGTIQPLQIPLTFFESVKQYLSSSQPNIARLVQVSVFDFRGGAY
ncbi:hypothetical protein V6N12_040160 [Hibiscus sabdariffa]|uniref:C3H1-type domain-containing protein n=1 Tax=Hibiscus sabdariffa TaxID=183260 RepID=A0ABR2E2V4_9ROSI